LDPWLGDARNAATARTRREKTYRPLQDRARPLGQSLSGEVGLVAAFLAQVIDDARSDNVDHRQAACWFLRDEGAVTFWCSLGGLDPQAFLEHVRRARGPG